MDTAHPILTLMGANRLPSSSRLTAVKNGSASLKPPRAEEPYSEKHLKSQALQATHRVTLVVYAWNNAQPGTLSWTFTNARQALVAARALRNAERWASLAGETRDIDAARKRGDLLFET